MNVATQTEIKGIESEPTTLKDWLIYFYSRKGLKSIAQGKAEYCLANRQLLSIYLKYEKDILDILDNHILVIHFYKNKSIETYMCLKAIQILARQIVEE